MIIASITAMSTSFCGPPVASLTYVVLSSTSYLNANRSLDSEPELYPKLPFAGMVQFFDKSLGDELMLGYEEIVGKDDGTCVGLLVGCRDILGDDETAGLLDGCKDVLGDDETAGLLVGCKDVLGDDETAGLLVGCKDVLGDDETVGLLVGCNDVLGDDVTVG